LARWGGRSLRWLAGFPVSDATNSYRMYDAALVQRTEIESDGDFVRPGYEQGNPEFRQKPQRDQNRAG
ncbi:MAG: hypothetical protein ACXWE4_05105, partial [Methylobacter sp.]